jgi:hypothetical protein
MASARSSKRLKGKPPSAEKSLKRARSGSVRAFPPAQLPITRKAKSKKRRTQREAEDEPVQPQSNAIAAHITIRSSPPVPPSSPLDLPTRRKQVQREPPPPFDPSQKQETTHTVTIFITPVVDDKRKDKTFSKSININHPECPDLDDLRAFLFAKYLSGFIAERSLSEPERPRFSYWTARIGSSKALDSIHVDDDDSWETLLTTLRQMEKDGGEKNKKNCHQVYIDAYYRCFDRKQTPELPQAKGKNKAQPYTMRPTRLESPPVEPSSDRAEDDTQGNDDDLDAP